MKFTKLTSKTLSAQVKEVVSDMIRESEFIDELPSEQGLATQSEVSRNIVREALKGLEDKGLVMSRHEIGTFVTRYNGSENIHYDVSALGSTTKVVSGHGYVPNTQSVFVDVRMAGPEVSKRLGSGTPMKVLYIERVRTADDTPIVFVEDYIPYVGGMLEGFSSHTIPSLFQFINRYAPVSFANCSIHVVLSDGRQMDKLSLTDPKALLLLQQIHCSSKGNPIFHSGNYFITEKLEFNLIQRCVGQTRVRGPD